MNDPFSRESMDLDIDEFDPSQEVTNEQFITVSHKMMKLDLECAFNHWAHVDIDDHLSEDSQDEMLAVIHHLENVATGVNEVAQRMVEKLSPESRGKFMRTKLEAIHGTEFEMRPFYDDEHNVIGYGFKPKDLDVDIEEVTTWLRDQAGGE